MLGETNFSRNLVDDVSVELEYGFSHLNFNTTSTFDVKFAEAILNKLNRENYF